MPKLFMLLIGCSPEGRHTEQHDVFFSIGENIRDIIPQAQAFWPEANGTLHIDAWREVTMVNGFSVCASETSAHSGPQLFFINLGGYKSGEFEEFHYKMLVAANDKGEAIKKSKNTAFFKHTGFKGANAHIDDKFGVDVDDIFAIRDILPVSVKNQYGLALDFVAGAKEEDELHLGYFRPETVDRWAPIHQ